MFVNKYDNLEEWIKSIQRILKSPSIIDQSVKYGSKYVQNFNSEHLTAKIIAIVQDLLK